MSFFFRPAKKNYPDYYTRRVPIFWYRKYIVMHNCTQNCNCSSV